MITLFFKNNGSTFAVGQSSIINKQTMKKNRTDLISPAE
jgi:hypothetical protein